jgi:hypothetical protein
MSLIKRIFGGAKTGAEYQRRYVPVSASAKAHEEMQRDLVLAGITDAHPVWQAVLSLVDEHAQRELEGALAPNLTNEQRQYASGAAATADYLAQMLRDARLLAAQKASKHKDAE